MKRFGDLVVEEGYATEEQVMKALAYQSQSEILLGRIMIDMGFITTEEKEKVFTYEKTPEGANKKFGEICVELNLTSRDHVEKALAFQKKGKGFLGEIMLELGYLTEQQKDNLLKKQLEQMSDHNND